MQSSDTKVPFFAAGAALLSTAAYLVMRSKSAKPSEQQTQESNNNKVVVLLGDVGGTNIRLTLRRLDLETRQSEEVKPFQKFPSQEEPSFESAVIKYLDGLKGTADFPQLGVVGIAGEVNNNTVKTTNVKDWPVSDGDSIAEN